MAGQNGTRPARTMVMRPVQVTRSDRGVIERVAAGLRKRRFVKDAEALERVVQRWDGAEGMVIVHGQQLEELYARVREAEGKQEAAAK